MIASPWAALAATHARAIPHAPEDEMTRDRMEEIARGNIERHLGDVAEDADSIYDEAYTLAFDALADAGVDHGTAGEVARRVAQGFAQP